MTREEKRLRREEMRTYKAEGHTAKEVAEKFSVAEGYAQQICAGIANQSFRGQFNKETRPSSQGHNQYTSTSKKAEAAKLRRINRVVQDNAPDFEYAGGYTDGDGTVRLRCKKCGHINTKAWQTVRHAHLGKKLTCAGCTAARKAGKEKAKAEARAAKIKLKRRDRVPVQAVMIINTCKECGAPFITGKANACFCSEDCRRKAQNNHHDRRLKGKVVDRDITLQKLYRRDGGVCYLCGGQCDWTDIDERDGVLIAGDSYPSIDHVVPLAGEGKHEWKNVRLAHRICNTRKSDSPPVAL